MERLRIYKVKSGFSKYLIGFGAMLLIVGAFLLIKSIQGNTRPNLFTVALSIQGVFFIFLGYTNLRSRKYFIEWDDSQLRYLLPGEKTISLIHFSEIRNVRMELFAIRLELESAETKVISLESLQFEQIQSIKQKFEQIKLSSAGVKG